MKINVSYDSSAATAPSWFTAAVNTAVTTMDALVTTPISLNLTLSWGEENNNAIRSGAAAQNQSYGAYIDYATLRQALASHATSADDTTALAALGIANPTGTGQFYVPTAMQKALGLDDPNATSPDGFVGLDSSLNWSYDPNGPVSAGHYDPVATLEHEISEIMGRVGYLSDSQHPNQYGPMDLFRYSAPGQRALTPGGGYFSIDGQTMEKPLNNPVFGGDAADWAATVSGDTFGNTAAGVQNTFSAPDLQILDVLGYTLGAAPATAAEASSPAPSTPPALTFDTTVSFQGPRRVTFTGIVSDTSASIEIFDGAADLGSASLKSDGTWSLTTILPASSQDAISAVATNAAGQSTTIAPDFSIETGIHGAPYVTTQQIYDDNGNVTGNVFVKRNGATHAMAAHPSRLAHAATNQSVADATSGASDGQTFHVGHDATLTGGGGADTFVFRAHPGQATVTDFVAGGADHDTLSLASSSFSSLADVLHHARQIGGDAVITLGPHDTITLQNTSLVALRHNAGDISFHG